MPDFEDVIQRFWDRGSGSLDQRPLSDDAVRRAQAKLGVKLPEEFVRLLRRQNGGAINPDLTAFPAPKPTSWAPDHVPFTDCFGIGEGFGSITESPELNEEWGQPLDLVLISGDGHWWIALDYRNDPGANPPVVWYDNEVGEDVRLASSFREFIEGLRPADDFIDEDET